MKNREKSKRTVEYVFCDAPRKDKDYLRWSAATGPVFCDRKSQPFEGCGVYKVKHQGQDKNGKPFTVVVPELLLPAGDCATLFRDFDPENVYAARIRRRFGRIRLQTMRDLLELVYSKGLLQIVDVASIPQDCEGLEFCIDKSATYAMLCPDQEIPVYYTNKEIKRVSVQWIYEHRDQLQNATAKVHSTKEHPVLISFSRVAIK